MDEHRESGFFDMKFVINMTTTVVGLSGMAIWMYKSNSELQARIARLENICQQQDQVIRHMLGPDPRQITEPDLRQVGGQDPRRTRASEPDQQIVEQEHEQVRPPQADKKEKQRKNRKKKTAKNDRDDIDVDALIDGEFIIEYDDQNSDGSKKNM